MALVFSFFKTKASQPADSEHRSVYDAGSYFDEHQGSRMTSIAPTVTCAAGLLRGSVRPRRCIDADGERARRGVETAVRRLSSAALSASTGEAFIAFDIDADYRRYIEANRVTIAWPHFSTRGRIQVPWGTREDGPGANGVRPGNLGANPSVYRRRNFAPCRAGSSPSPAISARNS